MWDLPGSEGLRALNRMYLRDTHAAIIIYDVCCKASLEYAETMFRELNEYAPSELVIALVGNKMDDEGIHFVTSTDGNNMARKYKVQIAF